jgi:hypothetical protein
MIKILDHSGQLVKKHIIPAIAFLRSRFNIQLSTMFSVDYLQTHGQPSSVLSADFEACDKFYRSIAMEYVGSIYEALLMYN